MEYLSLTLALTLALTLELETSMEGFCARASGELRPESQAQAGTRIVNPETSESQTLHSPLQAACCHTN